MEAERASSSSARRPYNMSKTTSSPVRDFSPLLGVRISGAKRKALWQKNAPNASFNSSEDYATAVADAICYAGFVSDSEAKSLAGFLSALAVGNQSQIRQLFEQDGEKKGMSSADKLLADLL